MPLFSGNADVTIDAKQRLAIPARHRELCTPERDGEGWYVVPWGSHLHLYTERKFEELAALGEESLLPDADEESLEADFFSMAERVVPDSAGRITLPRQMLEHTRLGTEVVVIGARTRLEVRDRATWKATLPDRLASLPTLAARMRGMLRAARDGASRDSRGGASPH